MIADKQIAQFNAKLAIVMRKLQQDYYAAAALVNAQKTLSARLAFVSAMQPELYRILAESGYTELVNGLIASDPDLIADIRKIHKITGIPVAFTTLDKNVLLALQKTELTFFNGLSDKMISDVHGKLMEAVLSGVSDKNFIRSIEGVIDDKHLRYAETYAQTSRNTYMQNVEKLSAENWKRETGLDLYWMYVGPIDDKNRDECIWATDKEYFTDEEMQDFEAAYGIRYNCRHEFWQITKEIYDEAEITEDDLTDESRERRDRVLEFFGDKDSGVDNRPMPTQEAIDRSLQTQSVSSRHESVGLKEKYYYNDGVTDLTKEFVAKMKEELPDTNITLSEWQSKGGRSNYLTAQYQAGNKYMAPQIRISDHGIGMRRMTERQEVLLNSTEAINLFVKEYKQKAIGLTSEVSQTADYYGRLIKANPSIYDDAITASNYKNRDNMVRRYSNFLEKWKSEIADQYAGNEYTYKLIDGTYKIDDTSITEIIRNITKTGGK